MEFAGRRGESELMARRPRKMLAARLNELAN
jgi:hypothetical protein